MDSFEKLGIIRTVPKKDKPLSAADFFLRADTFIFSETWLHVRTPRELQGLFVDSMIVMKAFASECYLKCLIKLEGADPPEIHHLLNLFEKLTLDSKKRIEGWWNKYSRPHIDGWRRDHPKQKFPRTLRGCLNESAQAFIDWRYKSPDAYYAWSAMAFPMFVRYRIVELTNWGYNPPHPLSELNPHSEFVERKGDAFDMPTISGGIIKYEPPAFEAAAARLRPNRHDFSSD